MSKIHRKTEFGNPILRGHNKQLNDTETLFVDRVEDTKSYMTFSEYKKMRAKEKR